MGWLENRVPPLLLLLVAAVAGFVLYRCELLQAGYWPDSTAKFVAAGACLLLGAAFMLAGVFEFRRHRTTVNPLAIEQSTALVDSGIYRITRNPMYVGMALVLLGWILLLGQLSSLWLIAAFVAYLHRFQVVPEQRALLQQFGNSFANYQQRVRPWL